MTEVFGPIVKTSFGAVRTMDYQASLDLVANYPTNAVRTFRAMDYGATTPDFQAATQRCVDGRKASTIPADVKAKAATYAPQLVATMRENVRRFARHQTAGSLDTSKLVRLARPSSQAQFERDAQFAFRARVGCPRIAPLKIAILADMNWDIRKGDPAYAPRVGTLAFILSDAAACAGLQCAAYGVRGRLTHPDQVGMTGSNCSLLSRIVAYGERIRPVDYRAHTEHMLYIDGFRHSGYVLYGGGGSSSCDGSGGPTYAREHEQASFVVGVGTFLDAGKCDVVLAPSTSLHDAVGTIHAALRARNRADAA